MIYAGLLLRLLKLNTLDSVTSVCMFSKLCQISVSFKFRRPKPLSPAPAGRGFDITLLAEFPLECYFLLDPPIIGI